MRNAKLFGGRPTVSCIAAFTKCAEYWTTKYLMQVERLQPGRLGRRTVIQMGSDGIARMKRMYIDFNALEDEWETYQSAVFQMIVNCFAKNILGEDTDRFLEMVMAMNKWKKIEDETIVLAPRSSGKTVTLRGATATLLVNVPGFTANVYAGNSDRAHDLYNGIVACVQKLIRRMDPAKRPKGVTVTEKIMVLYFSDEDVRWVRPYSTIGLVSGGARYRELLFIIYYQSYRRRRRVRSKVRHHKNPEDRRRTGE
jgi:hypothetical protein